jgi:formate-nitrite transporter family protein
MPIRRTGKNLSREGDGSASPVQKELERPTAIQIYAQVAKNARQELGRSARSLAISGFAGGITMGLTGLATAIASAELGTGGPAQFITNLLYPVGFIAVILGRAQLFTENTLYPVALVLTERRHYLATLRLWTIVLVCNCLGALAFAALLFAQMRCSQSMLRVLSLSALRSPITRSPPSSGVPSSAVGSSRSSHGWSAAATPSADPCSSSGYWPSSSASATSLTALPAAVRSFPLCCTIGCLPRAICDGCGLQCWATS